VGPAGVVAAAGALPDAPEPPAAGAAEALALDDSVVCAFSAALDSPAEEPAPSPPGALAWVAVSGFAAAFSRAF
jgi:hypothetical protein